MDSCSWLASVDRMDRQMVSQSTVCNAALQYPACCVHEPAETNVGRTERRTCFVIYSVVMFTSNTSTTRPPSRHSTVLRPGLGPDITPITTDNLRTAVTDILLVMHQNNEWMPQQTWNHVLNTHGSAPFDVKLNLIGGGKILVHVAICYRDEAKIEGEIGNN